MQHETPENDPAYMEELERIQDTYAARDEQKVKHSEHATQVQTHINALETLLVHLAQENKIPRGDFITACLHIDACKLPLQDIVNAG